MEPFKMKPRAALVTVLVLWLMVGGAVALVTTMLLQAGQDAMVYVVTSLIPLLFVFVAVSTTFSLVVSGVVIRDGQLMWTSAVGFKRSTVVIPLADVDAIWDYRRSTMSGNRVQTAAGLAFRRRDGYVLHLDLTPYTEAQRQSLVDVITRQNVHVVVLIPERDTGKIYRTGAGPEWECPSEPTPHAEPRYRSPDAPVSEPETPRQPAAGVSAEASPAVVYHYTVYEHGDGARCGVCGAHIASAGTPGEHEIGGYLSANGKKWVCKACWARFAKEYNWIDE